MYRAYLHRIRYVSVENAAENIHITLATTGGGNGKNWKQGEDWDA